MSLSRAEQLTLQFYEWERQGRGWNVFDSPVQLEPLFIPFDVHADLITVKPRIDDGRRPSFLEIIGNAIQNAFFKPESGLQADTAEKPLQAYTFHSDESLRAVSISLSPDEKLKVQDIEKFLTMLTYCRTQISFEIIATHTSIRIQFVCRESDMLHVESQLQAYFPAAILRDQTNTIGSILQREHHTSVLDFGLQEEFMRPLLSDAKFDTDPLTGVFGVLEHLRENEYALIQVLFNGTANPWAGSIHASVTDGKGDSFFKDAPEMPKLALEKISAPLFGVGIRVIGQSTTDENAFKIVERVGSALMQSTRSTGNTLIALNNNGYGHEEHLYDIIMRQTRRAGMILNAKELATFVH